MDSRVNNVPKLSGAPDKNIRPDMPAPIVVDGNIARCRCCTRCIGIIEKRNLINGNMMMTNRTVFRCVSCLAKNVFEPRT